MVLQFDELVVDKVLEDEDEMDGILDDICSIIDIHDVVLEAYRLKLQVLNVHLIGPGVDSKNS